MRALFGEYLRKLRLERDLSLRKFSSLCEMDPGNLSRIERGMFPPPANEKIEKMAEVLNLARGSEEWQNLTDYAYVTRREIPEGVLSDEELLEKLPVLFRKLTGAKLTPDELDHLIEIIRKA